MNSLLEYIKDFQFSYQDERILWCLGILLLIFLVTKSKLRALVGVIGIFLSFKILCYCFTLTNHIPIAFGLAAGFSFAILAWTFMPLFYN